MGSKNNPATIGAFDEHIFAKYQQVKVSVLSDVKPDVQCLITLKKKFLSGEVGTVVLTYNKNKLQQYDKAKTLLISLRAEILADIKMPIAIREQYVLAITEKMTKLDMLEQTQATLTSVDVTAAMRQFQACSDVLYGTIDETIFCKTMQTIERDILRKVQKYSAASVRRAPAERLLALVVRYKTCTPDFHSLAVTPRERKTKESHITDADELKRLFENGLKEYHINSDWSVVIDKRGARSTISVSYNLQKIYLPSSAQIEKRARRKHLTMSRINALIAHEIGTHVVRKENGEKSRLKLLSVGLSGYEQGEEGLATYREQVAQSLHGHAGLEAYFAIGIAKGLDAGVPRNFVDVHTVLTDYYQVFENTTEYHAKELAWNRCIRIFRGTTGTVPGVVFSKDLMYRHGNINHWEAVLNGSLNGIDVDRGKFDPTNQAHLKFLQELDMLSA